MYIYRIFSVLSLLAVSAAVLNACDKNVAHSEGENVVIRIGFVGPLTGPQAHLGEDSKKGAQLAIDDINGRRVMLDNRPVRFELVCEDDQADPKTASIVAQRLVDQGAQGVIGHFNSGTSIPASKIYADAGIPQISPSATAIRYTNQGFKTTFRTMANDIQQGRVLGEFAVKEMGAGYVAIIDDRTAYGQGLADQVERSIIHAGGEVVAREYTSDHATDFMAILTVIKAKEPDVIFFGGVDAQAILMIRQMHQFGLKAKFLGGDAIRTAEFLNSTVPDSEDVTASSPGLPLEKMPGGAAFEKRFSARYGTIQSNAPYAYDAVTALIEAMKRAGSADPAKYLPELSKVHFTGITGEIAFDEKGDRRDSAITVYRVKHGKWHFVETYQRIVREDQGRATAGMIASEAASNKRNRLPEH